MWPFGNPVASPVAPVVPPVLDLKALRKKRVEEAERRRAEIEEQVAIEEALLFAEEDGDLLRQELKDLRDARRNRRKKPAAKGP